MKTYRQIFLLLLIILGNTLANNSICQDPLMEILKDELQREFEVLKHEEQAPYYIDYRVSDIKTVTVSASFGSLIKSTENRSRLFSTTVRIGDYSFDNTHPSGDNVKFLGFDRSFSINIPLENDAIAIKQKIWKATDIVFKNSVSSYKAIQNKPNIREEKSNPDFTKEIPAISIEEPIEEIFQSFDKELWELNMRRCSEPFLSDKAIFEGTAEFNYWIERKYFVSTEGSQIIQNYRYANIKLSGTIKSDDGDIIPLFRSYYALSPSDLPEVDSIIFDAQNMVSILKELSNATLAEPYAGPAILSPDAAGVFFHEIFGHRIEGHRLNLITDGHTFKTKIGQQVLPDYLSIYYDPSLTYMKGKYLIGNYKFDDQGVPASRVIIVDDGILKNFLMSRKPIKNFQKSNGHGRSVPGMEPVSRQSNMIIETAKSYTDNQLRKMLIKKCRKMGLPYGYYFEEVAGGFTRTDRFAPNVFNINPTKVYRIYVDGRPDELVRGVNLIGTPLVIFSKIEAVGDKSGIFSGMCGAESGYLPVSVISPALLVSQIETQKIPEEQQTLPILPIPGKRDK